MAGEPFIGEVRLFGFSYAPRNWALAQGQTLPINQYQALFSLFGTTYGGNGQTTFNLPDLRGRIPIGQGQRAGGSAYGMGQIAGTEATTLQTANLPPHVHTFTGTLSASQAKATENTPDNGSVLGRSNATNDSPLIYVPAGTGTVTLNGVSGTTQPTGSGTPVSTLSPVLGLNYSVALSGIFPSRN